MDPVIVTRQNAALLSDKEDIWADNASSSPYFGNVYVCNTAFRSVGGPPEPIMLSASSDGGSTWRQRQLTSATSNAQSGGRQGCAVRTDSAGVVYVVWEGTAAGQSVFYLARSFDGGATSRSPADRHRARRRRPRPGVGPDRVRRVRRDPHRQLPQPEHRQRRPHRRRRHQHAGAHLAGRRRHGLNHEQALVQTSTNRGLTWSAPVNAAEAGDRPDNPAVAISPTGSDLYLVYNAYLQPFQTTTANPRRMQGVVRHANLGPVARSAAARPCTAGRSATPGARPGR